MLLDVLFLENVASLERDNRLAEGFLGEAAGIDGGHSKISISIIN